MDADVSTISIMEHPELIVWPVWHDTKCHATDRDLILSLRLNLVAIAVDQISRLDDPVCRPITDSDSAVWCRPIPPSRPPDRSQRERVRTASVRHGFTADGLARCSCCCCCCCDRRCHGMDFQGNPAARVESGDRPRPGLSGQQGFSVRDRVSDHDRDSLILARPRSRSPDRRVSRPRFLQLSQ